MITEIIAPEIERSQFSAPQGEPRDEEANNKTEIFGKQCTSPRKGKQQMKIRSRTLNFFKELLGKGKLEVFHKTCSKKCNVTCLYLHCNCIHESREEQEEHLHIDKIFS